MTMNGKKLRSVSDLKRNFAIDELIGNYYSGELEYFLKETGNLDMIRKIRNIRPCLKNSKNYLFFL